MTSPNPSQNLSQNPSPHPVVNDPETRPPLPNETAYVHAGVNPGAHGAVATGIELSTTFTMVEPGVPGRYDYARAQNPTREALENVEDLLRDIDQALG